LPFVFFGDGEIKKEFVMKKIFSRALLLIFIGGFLLSAPNFSAQVYATEPTDSGNPLNTTQGLFVQATISTLITYSRNSKTPGFSPILDLLTMAFLGSTFGSNYKPIFFQNGQNPSTFITGLKNQSPAQLIKIFTHDIIPGATSNNGVEE
jgi:hypothetical protein